jgi:hypothetical protein
MLNNIYFNNLGYIESRLPDDLFLKIKKEIFKIKEGSTKEYTTGLTGNGVPKHYSLNKNLNELNEFLQNLIIEFDKEYDYLRHVSVLDKNVPFHFKKPWINFQKKFEFLPHHIHDGIFSYNIWIQIPYDINKEISNGKHASLFEFIYTNILGQTRNHLIKIDKSYEGKIILFPSSLMHGVYPFYTSDEIRISVAGNVHLKSS